MDACRKTAESAANATYLAWSEQVCGEKLKAVDALGMRVEAFDTAITDVMQRLEKVTLVVTSRATTVRLRV